MSEILLDVTFWFNELLGGAETIAAKQTITIAVIVNNETEERSREIHECEQALMEMYREIEFNFMIIDRHDRPVEEFIHNDGRLR